MTSDTTKLNQEARMLSHHDRYAARLSALKHPGDTTTIDGVDVKREALRYVIDGTTFAYDVTDAVTVILALTSIAEEPA